MTICLLLTVKKKLPTSKQNEKYYLNMKHDFTMISGYYINFLNFKYCIKFRMSVHCLSDGF